MKYLRQLVWVFSLPFFLFNCQEPQPQSTSIPLQLNETNCNAFARQIENSVNNGNADFYNSVFNKDYIRNNIADNSIVYSSLDLDMGKQLFNNCFHEGDYAAKCIEEGGDMKFTRYYFSNNEHHIIIRTYNNFSLNFYDYIIDTCNNAIKINDGFIYNIGSTLSNNIKMTMLYEILENTVPQGNTSYLRQADELLKTENNQAAFNLLQEHKETLKEYPLYWQLYIAALYTSKGFQNYESELNKLALDGIDKRTIQLHQLHYFMNQGMIKNTEETINLMINETGDDPIYLLMFAKANFIAKNFQDAITCINTSEKYLPLLWDLWYLKLECYYETDNQTEFINTLKLATKAYNMTEDELNEMVKKRFPNMENKK